MRTTMVSRSSMLGSCLLLSSAFTARFVDAQEMPPESYFGGADHQPYLDWVETLEPMGYDRHSFLGSTSDPSKGMAVHWKIADDRLHLALAARATGWMGFGLADAGGMPGSDMVLFEAQNPEAVKDAHVASVLQPIMDDCQDWALTDSVVNSDDGFIMIQAHRLLNTGDVEHDHPIVDDSKRSVASARVIAAWGESSTVTAHAPVDNAMGRIRWYAPPVPLPSVIADPGQEGEVAAFSEGSTQGYFEFRAEDHPIKTQETEYAYFCLSYNDLIAKGVPVDTKYITAVDYVIDDDAKDHVHHFIVRGSMEENNDFECTQAAIFEGMNFIETVVGWAPGQEPWLLPDNIGLPFMSGEHGYKSLLMEVHYDNPQGIEGILDSSGIRLFYTSEEKEHEAALLQVGDPWVGLTNQPVGDGYVEHIFECPSSCSEVALDEPVTVLREALHMHRTGVRMFNEHIRDGEVIRNSRAEYYSFDHQGTHEVPQQPFQVMPGDSFRTVCQFHSKQGEKWGLASSDEMCIAFLLYYPRKTIGPLNFPWICGPTMFMDSCKAAHSSNALATESDLGRVFGSTKDENAQCPTEPVGSSGSDGDTSNVRGAGSSATTTAVGLVTKAALVLIMTVGATTVV